MSNIELEYKNEINYIELTPHFITKTEMSDDEWKLLTESKTFCILPWVHLHAFPDGRAYPCCLSDYQFPIGHLRKNSMKEVWNQSKIKQMRINMLDGKVCKECTKCYEHEKIGAFSMRNDSNRNFGHLIKETAQTKADGTLDEFKIRYWDIRFSNLCNFACRTCGPIFSSNWYSDYRKLYNKDPDVNGRPMIKVEYATGDEDSMQAQMEEHIPYLEQVYFAGGEPLIMKEHYLLLDKLIALGKTNVRLTYNTNFSEMRYKDKSIFDYWKQFKYIAVGASLDAMGPQAELMRKGTNWNQILKNRERMKIEAPHVNFYVSSTVSVMNILHVLDFHKEWVKQGLIKAEDWNINPCLGPSWYRADILPPEFKKRVVYPAYEKHLEWLRPQDTVLRRATNGYESLVNLMKANDASDNWKTFVFETEKLDNLRHESFWDTFPEFKELQHG